MTPKTTHSNYRADIDGLRALAVLSVVLYHAFPSVVRGGFIGVDIFFVISGYLISKILFQSLEEGTFSFLKFYARRIRRIFPSLIVVLLACLGFGWLELFTEEYQQLGKHILAGAGFASNIVLWDEEGYFNTAGASKPLLHLWSLGVEEQFYLLWPFFLWFAWKRKWNLLYTTTILCIVSFVFNLVEVNREKLTAFYFPHTRFWELLSGGFLAWQTVFKKKPLSSKLVSNITSLMGALFIALGLYYIKEYSAFPGTWALLPVLGTILIIAAGPCAWINKSIFSNRIVVWFGLISFPLYLWHWPLLSFATITSMDPPSQWLRTTLVLFSIILAGLTYEFVEKPIRFGRHSTALTFPLLISIFSIGYFGYYIYYSQGVRTRAVVKREIPFFSFEARDTEASYSSLFQHYLGDGALKPVILIMGDSFSPNWQAALGNHIDLKKYDVVNISYLGCDIEIDANKITATATDKDYSRYCDPFSTFINDRSVIDRLAAVMHVSYRPFEYQANLKRFEIIRWLQEKRPRTEAFIFGNYYQMNYSKQSSCLKWMYRMQQGPETCLQLSDYPAAELKINELPFYPKEINFTYVDIIKLHCRYNKKECSYQSRGVPFTRDTDHLTATFIDSLFTDIREKKPQEVKNLGLAKYLDSRF